jgi:hypothetical protein
MEFKRHPLLALVRAWLSSQGKSSLFDISEWHSNGLWKGWNLGDVPPHLSRVVQSFLLLINGSTLVHRQQRDNRGWGTSRYTVKEGYKLLIKQSQLLEKSNIWNTIWHIDRLPKVNIFGWKLAHNKLLTGGKSSQKRILGTI